MDKPQSLEDCEIQLRQISQDLDSVTDYMYDEESCQDTNVTAVAEDISRLYKEIDEKLGELHEIVTESIRMG